MSKYLFFAILASFLVLGCNKDKKTITIIGENSSTMLSMQELKKDYETSNNVVLDFKVNSFEDAFNKSNQDFANKTGLYDIVLQYNFSLAPFVKNNYVFNLNELKSKSKNTKYDFENDIFDNVWKDIGYYYADPKNINDNFIPISYPFAANTMLLVYNKDLFNDPIQQKAYKDLYGEELKIPSDWVSFKKVAQFFTQPEKGLNGICIQGATGGWLYYEWCNYVQGFGGKVMDKKQGWQGDLNTKVLITEPKVIEATNYLLSLKPYNAGNFSTTDGVEQRNIFKKGKVAMAIVWSDYAFGLIDDGNGKFDQRFGFSPTPGNNSMVAGGAFFINRQSKVTEEAFEYVMYLLKKENQVKMVQFGLCSPIKSVYDDPKVQNIPYIVALKNSLQRADYMLEAGPDADLISVTLTDYLQKIWSGSVSVEDGLKAAKLEIEKERVKFYQ